MDQIQTPQDKEKQQIERVESVFLQTIRQMGRIWASMLPPGMNKTQFRILERLHYGGPQMVSVLADTLFVTAGAITGIADKLIESGLVTRKRGEEDRRVVHLEITENGRTLLHELLEQRNRVFLACIQGLNEEDIERWVDVMQHISGNVDRLMKE